MAHYDVTSTVFRQRDKPPSVCGPVYGSWLASRSENTGVLAHTAPITFE
jgi:hypothetical protein